MMDEFDLVKRLGVRVLEDPDLDVSIVYVPEHRVALVRTDLDAETRIGAADWLLSACTSRLATPA